MEASNSARPVGRPRQHEAKRAEVIQMLEQGTKTPKEISELTGVPFYKVQEIRRNLPQEPTAPSAEGQ